MTFLGGDEEESLLCSCVIDAFTLWLTRTLVGETTMPSRMLHYVMHFPSSLIDTSVLFFIFFVPLIPIFCLTFSMVTDNHTFVLG